LIDAYINITPTAKYGGNTGIQRVVRELYNILDNKEFYGLNFKFIVCVRHGIWMTYSDYLSYAQEIESCHKQQLIRMLKSCAKQILPKFMTNRLALLIWRLKHYMAEAKFSKSSDDVKEMFARNSILINLDAGWVDDWRYISSINVPMIQVVYDIIPITHPQFCTALYGKLFAEWLNAALKSSVAVISISKSALHDIKNYAEYAHFKQLLYHFFYLGSDFTNKVDGTPKDTVKTPTKKRYFIVVGSIEPRKNHITLINAFHIYRSCGGEWDLVVVGRTSGQASNIVDTILNSKYFGSELFWLNDVSDRGLAHLYKEASAAIIPSFAEGFGLPLIEALHYGKPVIASDMPVFREIGGDSINYFTVDSAERLAETMTTVSSKNAATNDFTDINTKHYLSWAESANMFANAVSEIVESVGLKDTD